MSLTILLFYLLIFVVVVFIVFFFYGELIQVMIVQLYLPDRPVLGPGSGVRRNGKHSSPSLE